ncbi:hypothetical protein FZEAL_4576 [Fusarium zealandicum]|uniref:Uncharacterized protein n=1 Tax=Fusarium zealandicum TaxID=1053134 RepID=A0A8H4XKN7_9HYPO|nr:hypothetical protein FZEAL_4576 [Fusarium zealandicum]
MNASIEPEWQPQAIVFDLLTGLLDSWSLWDASTPSKSQEEGRRWRYRYLELTFGAGAYKSYESFVREAASDVGLPESAPDALLHKWGTLRTWPDVIPVLRRLKAQGYKLGVVTNCSMHLGHMAVHHIEEQASLMADEEFKFDATITAEESGFYKPVDRAYTGILPMLGVEVEDVLFVAGSAGDVQGATDAGMKVVWHNKVGLEPKGNAAPLKEGRTLGDALGEYLVKGGQLIHPLHHFSDSFTLFTTIMSSYAITGASRGIGLEFVRQLSQNPSNVVFAIVRNPEAPKLRALMQPNVHVVKGDVTDPASIRKAAEDVALISNGKLDVFIHNSNAVDLSTVPLTPSQIPFDIEATKELFSLPFSTAVYGALWATNAFLPLIEKGSSKKIIHISTGLVDLNTIRVAGISDSIFYSVAKAAMNVQVAKYAVELKPKGIKTLALSPGWVDTWDGPGPKPAEMVGAIKDLGQRFAKYSLTLAEQIKPEESVRMQLAVIERLDEEMSGMFLSQRGLETKF